MRQKYSRLKEVKRLKNRKRRIAFISTFFSIHSVLEAVLLTEKNSTPGVSGIKEG